MDPIICFSSLWLSIAAFHNRIVKKGTSDSKHAQKGNKKVIVKKEDKTEIQNIFCRDKTVDELLPTTYVDLMGKVFGSLGLLTLNWHWHMYVVYNVICMQDQCGQHSWFSKL